jgi:hypothetical protein
MGSAGQAVSVLMVKAPGSSVAESLAGRLTELAAAVVTVENVYDAVVALSRRRPPIGVAFVPVDRLDEREMEIFDFLRHRFPALKVVAYGDPLYGTRLASAAASGACSIIAGPVVNGQLDVLLSSPARRTRGVSEQITPPAAGKVARKAAAKPRPAKTPKRPPLETPTEAVLSEEEMTALLGDVDDLPAGPKPRSQRPTGEAGRQATGPRRRRRSRPSRDKRSKS